MPILPPSPPSITPYIIYGGHFTYANVMPVANGKVVFELSADGVANYSGPLFNYTFSLDANGNIPFTGNTIIGNDNIYPSGTSYNVFVYNAQGTLVYGLESFRILQGPIINFSNVFPIFESVYLSGPVPPIFEVEIINGAFKDSSGNIITNGKILFQPLYDQDLISGGHVSKTGIYFNLDVNGNVVPGSLLYSNDGYLTPNSVYNVSIFNNSIGSVVYGPFSYYIDTVNGTTAIFDMSNVILNDENVYIRNTNNVPPSPVSVSIFPTTDTIAVNQSTTFVATVLNSPNLGVVWLVDGISGGNAVVGVVSAGVYVAPAISGTHIVTAVSSIDSSARASATVVVLDAVVISTSLSPTSVTVSESTQIQFAVTVTGTTNQVVNWLVNGIVGGSSSAGDPGTGPSGTSTTQGTTTITTSQPVITTNSITFPSLIASDTASIITGLNLTFDGSPSSPQNKSIVGAGPYSGLELTGVAAGVHTATIVVTNALQQTCTLILQFVLGTSITGTITPTGLYTAPPLSGTFTITAQSQADITSTASSTVTVLPPSITVSVAPTSTTVVEGGSVQFIDTVSNNGLSSPAVTWSVDGVHGGNSSIGTISTSGLYTAPSSTGTHTVAATSVANPIVSATASIKVTTAVVTTISISPTSVSVIEGQNAQFVGTVAGNSNTSVIWKVDGTVGGSLASGFINTSGLYVAPSSVGTHTVTVVSVANNSITASSTVNVIVAPSTGILVANLMAHNTSANSAYNSTNFSANFGPFTCDTLTNATFPPTAACGFAIDNTQDMSFNPITPGHVSNTDVHTLVPSRPDLRWFEHWTPWFGGANHINIGVTCNTPAWIQARVTDSVNRGFNGCIIDWYGQGDRTDQVALLLQSYLRTVPNNNYTFAIMADKGIPNSSTASALQTQLQYVKTQYFSDPNYEKENSVPILLFFPPFNETAAEMIAIKSAIGGFWIWEGPGALTTTYIDGVFGWVNTYTTGISATDPYNLSTVESFMSNVSGSSKHCVAAIYAGFDGTLTKNTGWSLGKYLPRNGGDCVIQCASTINTSIVANVTRMQWVTCDDWEEGSAMEAGIVNGFTMSPTIGFSSPLYTLKWTFGSFTGDERTISHYEIYVTIDGVNAIFLGTSSVGSGTTGFVINNTALVNGTNYTLYLKAIGKPCIRDSMSAGVQFTYNP